jgi:hypothetical protein
MTEQMILIAGPYRSGTGDDLVKIEINVVNMQKCAYEVYKRGHLPVLGEWFALPLIEEAGSQKIGDEAFNDIFHPISIKILKRCDAILRIGGPSVGADEMVRMGRALGKQIYLTLEEVPEVKP